ncbi:MAG: hypothetical protein ACI9Q3_000728, partial [Maribacter sp.]
MFFSIFWYFKYRDKQRYNLIRIYLDLLVFLDSINYQELKDTAKHQGLRNQLATVLNAKGITDKNVLKAIKKIPRHLFIDSSFESHAYQDKA